MLGKITKFMILGLALTTGWYISTLIRHKEPSKSPFKIEHPTYQDITQYVNATGNLKALDQISIGSLVAGRVVKILADDNDIVKKDQILTIIDDGVGDTAVNQITAKLVEAKAIYAFQKQFYARQKALYTSGQLSKNLFEKYTQDYEVAKATVDDLQAQLAGKKKTYENLFIRAPEDGVVIAKRIDLGQMVASVFQPTTLYELAKDLTKMEAWINVDEADIGAVKEGQEAIFTVDSFPKRTYTAKVKRIQYLAKMVDNVVTYATILDVPNHDLSLRPGMTTNVDITTAQAKHVLAIPNKALRINQSWLEALAKKWGYTMSLKYDSIAPSTNKNKAGKQAHKPGDFIWVLEGRIIKQVYVKLGTFDTRLTHIETGINEQSSVICELEDVIQENSIIKSLFQKPGGIGK